MSDTLHEIGEKVRRLLADKANVPFEHVTLESRIHADLCIDSLDALEVLMEAEEQFNCHLDEDQLPGIETVAQFSEFVFNAVAG